MGRGAALVERCDPYERPIGLRVTRVVEPRKKRGFSSALAASAAGDVHVPQWHSRKPASWGGVQPSSSDATPMNDPSDSVSRGSLSRGKNVVFPPLTPRARRGTSMYPSG